MKKLILASILGLALSSGAAFADCGCKKCADEKSCAAGKEGKCDCKGCEHKGKECHSEKHNEKHKE